jgi:maleylacetoacetate isomerase
MKADESISNDQELTLYSYWRSSASYRVRIALNLKGLSYQVKPVHMVRHGGEQHGEAFRAINPQGLIPVLVHQGQIISQSLAICEYLDECFEQYPLLPAKPLERARTRSLASQVACEIHPLNNLRVTKYLRDQYGDVVNPVEWMRHWMIEGFSAIEQQLANADDPSAGRPGLFECFLVPQVYNAERFGTDLSAFTEIGRIVAHCRQLPAFIDAAPENQADAEEV